MASPDPVGLTKTSADLTPATGARTTRFCRPRPAFAKRLSGVCTPAEALMKPEAPPFVRAPRSLTGQPALRSNQPRPTLPRPPHPIPTFVTTANAPLCGTGCGSYGLDLGKTRREMFFAWGLDGWNQSDLLQEIRFCAQLHDAWSASWCGCTKPLSCAPIEFSSIARCALQRIDLVSRASCRCPLCAREADVLLRGSRDPRYGLHTRAVINS